MSSVIRTTEKGIVDGRRSNRAIEQAGSFSRKIVNETEPKRFSKEIREDNEFERECAHITIRARREIRRNKHADISSSIQAQSSRGEKRMLV